MKTFFTSDLHFGCVNLVKNTRTMYRDVEEHDATILDNINRAVDRRDRLILLGDLCLKKPGRYRQHIKCRNIVYLLGNHDKEAQIRAVFGSQVYQQKIVKGEHERFFCAHYPMAYWDRSHYCMTACYGHLHDDLEKEAIMDAAFPGRRSMDVGVDAAKRLLGEHRPFAEDEILDLLRDAKGHEAIWRDIPGTSETYQASSTGDIRSLPREETYELHGTTCTRWRRGTLLKPSLDREGYQVVSIRKDRERKARKVHRLVLETFNGASADQVLHGRGGKSNNSLANIHYGTREENWEDRRRDGTDLCKRVRRSDGKEYLSQTDAAKDCDCLPGGVSNVCYGKAKTAGGWGWSFI